MAKRLAIEWDSREIRVVAGILRGKQCTITDVVAAPLNSSKPEDVGDGLRKLLEEHNLQKLAASIALGRGKTELRELKLPPVPDAELPDMVRFQAIRTFATAGEKSAIDFVPARRDADGLRVVAASVGPEELKNCALIALPSQLTVERLALRPLAAVALYRHVSGHDTGETVLVDLLAEDADIVILRSGHVAFVRSIRLPDDEKIRVRTLASEVRRSLMACQDIGGEQLPRRVVLWGRADVHAEDVAKLSQALGSPVETLDPFSLVDLDSRLQSTLPSHVGRLAPLVGLLDAEVHHGHDLIDFLNPRRPPVPPSKRERFLIYGALAAAIIACILFLGWRKLHGLDRQIAELQSNLQSLKKLDDTATETINRTAQIDNFLDGDVFWLGEIRRFTANLPPSDELILNSLMADAPREGGGSLTLSGGAIKSETVSSLSEKLFAAGYSVESKGGINLVNERAPYRYEFNEAISVTAEDVRKSHQPADTPSTDEPPAEESSPSDSPALEPPPAVAPPAAPPSAEDVAGKSPVEDPEATGSPLPAEATATQASPPDEQNAPANGQGVQS